MIVGGAASSPHILAPRPCRTLLHGGTPCLLLIATKISKKTEPAKKRGKKTGPKASPNRVPRVVLFVSLQFIAVCPFSAASLPIIAKLPAHLPLPVFLPKGRQPAPLQSSVGNLEGIPLPRNPVETEAANNKKCCYWAFYFEILLNLRNFAS